MLVFKHSLSLILNEPKATDMYIRFGMFLPSLNETYNSYNLRGSADKSLARPGRKEATATKLGIYSTYST